MRLKLFLLFAFFYALQSVKSQILFQKLSNENLCAIDLDLMQKNYKLAYSNLTSEDYLFKGKEEEFKKCWINLMHDLNNYMQKNGLKLSPNTTCYNRIYFNPDGSISAYLYYLKGLNEAQEKKFDELIFQFLLLQKLNITSTQSYWQYGNLKLE
jgi:hypothetical protein